MLVGGGSAQAAARKPGAGGRGALSMGGGGMRGVYARFLAAMLVLICGAWFFMMRFHMADTEAFVVRALEAKVARQQTELMRLAEDTSVGEVFASHGALKSASASSSSLLSRSSPSAAAAATAEWFNGTQFHADMSAKSDALVRELVHRRSSRYWLESKLEWPADPIPPTDRYVTFTPWNGGFNNIRMSLEMAVAFAVATGRTLVLPPTYKMYLRGKSSLMSYFDFEDLRRGLPVLTYEEFFARVDFGRFQKEEFNENDVHGSTERYYTGLAKMPGVYDTGKHWGDRIGSQVVYCVPHCPPKSGKPNKSPHSSSGGGGGGGGGGQGALRGERAAPARGQAQQRQQRQQSPKQEQQEARWFAEFARKLHPMDVDDAAIASARVVHFPKNLLGHFYTMLYFRDPQAGRRVKRIVRDHVHFREDVLELAERIVARLGDFRFSCLHVRRNDFQFKDAWTPAEDIVRNVGPLFKPGEVIYVSTDELSSDTERKRKWSDPSAMVTVAKHTWFEPMKAAWGADKVVFLSDFFDDVLGSETPGIWLGCIESIVCARARVFVGTRKSTFSGYINRMRGYMPDVGQKLILDAQSVYPYDYYDYFQGPEWNHLPGAYGGGHPYWGREYKEAWEGVHDPLG